MITGFVSFSCKLLCRHSNMKAKPDKRKTKISLREFRDSVSIAFSPESTETFINCKMLSKYLGYNCWPCQSTILVQTEIAWLLDGFSRNFAMTFMVPRGWILQTLVILWLFLYHHNEVDIFCFEWNVSVTIEWSTITFGLEIHVHLRVNCNNVWLFILCH